MFRYLQRALEWECSYFLKIISYFKNAFKNILNLNFKNVQIVKNVKWVCNIIIVFKNDLQFQECLELMKNV